MPLDLSEVANDPEMGREVIVVRHTGTCGPGGWIPLATCQICAWGVWAIAEPRALVQLPEGDRVRGAVQFITTTPIFTTNEKRSGTSDTIFWAGNNYRVASVEPWSVDGYFSAILLRMTGS